MPDQFDNAFHESLQLEGRHVRLEALREEHIALLNAAAADGELWNLTVTSIPDAEGMRSYVETALQERARGEQLPFVVRHLATDRVVGSTRFYLINRQHRNLSIGYTWYSNSVQKTAVNTECKRLMLAHAFETAGAISVQWHTYHGNTQSQAAIRRLGAKFEGVLRNHQILPDGRIRHTHCFSMLPEEWPASKRFLDGRLRHYLENYAD